MEVQIDFWIYTVRDYFSSTNRVFVSDFRIFHVINFVVKAVLYV